MSSNPHLQRAREILAKCGVIANESDAIGGPALALEEVLSYLEEQEQRKQKSAKAGG